MGLLKEEGRQSEECESVEIESENDSSKMTDGDSPNENVSIFF